MPVPASGAVSSSPISDPAVRATIEHIRQEMETIQRTLQDMQVLELRQTHRAPIRPRVGMIAYADGVDWNPAAAGEGLVVFTSAGWVAV